MYGIALVQNQSEMAHYGYADTRAFLNELGYRVRLFTAENIDALRHELTKRDVDALVLGSNALNDKIIRTFFEDPDFREQLGEYLRGGAGLLCFHQLRLATLDDSSLGFLPDALGTLRARARPQAESAATGALTIPAGASDHISLLYPNRLRASDLADQALNFRSLRGLYWHQWENPRLSDWDVLIDDSSTEDVRPLVLATKETSNLRIVLSSLTLDWQRQREAVQNLLAYVVEGRHNTAILTPDRSSSPTFAYLLATLEAQKFPFQHYVGGENPKPLADYLIAGVHTTLVLGEGMAVDDLDPVMRQVVTRRVADGDLKLITLARPSGSLTTFSIASRESYARRLLSLAELAIQDELRHGNIDGSFWSTAESMQILEGMPSKRALYDGLVERSLTLASEHDRNGSYDEVFGVTCALYWMRTRYLAETSRATRTTESWLRSCLDQYDDRERALAYTTFATLGRLREPDLKALTEMLAELPWATLSEIDTLTYLRAALAAGISRPLPSLISALQDKQGPDGSWVDLATTASGASALLDARAVLRDDPTVAPQGVPALDGVIRQAIIHIQDSLPSGHAERGAYPWEGKASTTLRCLEAWLKFDAYVDLPVYEIVDHLHGSDAVAREIASTRTSLAVLEELKTENEAIRGQLSSIEPQVKVIRRKLVRQRVLIVPLLAAFYILFAILIASVGTDRGGIGPLMERAFVKPASIHVGVLAIVAAVAAIPWNRFIQFVRRQEY